MIEVTYDFQDGTTRGTMKGGKGQFNSYRLVDLRHLNDLRGLVHYEGQICQ
jgi:hypothetical protein